MLARESYFERDLTLASGRTSKYYIDCKRTLYLPRGAFLAGELMLELVTDEGIEQIGGMAAGALPVTDAILAAAYRHGVDLTGFFVRKETKTHGLQQQIEGAFRLGCFRHGRTRRGRGGRIRTRGAEIQLSLHGRRGTYRALCYLRWKARQA